MLVLGDFCCRVGWVGTVRYDIFSDFFGGRIASNFSLSRTGGGHVSKYWALTSSLLLERSYTAARRKTQICCGALGELGQASCHPLLEYSQLLTSQGFPAIVTRFYLKTRRRPAVMFRSTYIYPISQYETVMDWITKVLEYSLVSFLILLFSSHNIVEIETS
jgi:hypothetical protein